MNDTIQRNLSAMIPVEILNDPMAQALMAGMDTRRTGREVLIDTTDPQWAQRILHAKWLDAYAVGNFGQHDRDHHLCCEQRYQQRDGFRMVEVATNIFGYCVRDTHNDGQGVLFGGRDRPGTTWDEACEWAHQWHAKKPTHRMVVRGFCWDNEGKCEVALPFSSQLMRIAPATTPGTLTGN
jgi:hypothetical protein